MKKQLIAKLLVLGMVLAMLPAAAMASSNTAANTNETYANDVYDFGFVFDDTVTTTTPAEKPEEPAEPETTLPDVTAPVEVEETVSEEDAANLVKAAVEADVEVLTVTVETKVAMPAAALADHGNHIPLVHSQVHALQHRGSIKLLGQLMNCNHLPSS